MTEWSLTLVTAPANEPITLNEAKRHLRVDIDDDDDLIESLIVIARQHVENVTRRALITQTWDWYMDDFPDGDVMEIPLPPLRSVTSVTYTDEDGTAATFASTNYVTDTSSLPGRLRLTGSNSWPSVTLKELAGVVVRFVAGYGSTSADVPGPIRQAMLLAIGHWYENRELVVMTGAVPKEVPFGVELLLASYRAYRW